MEITAIELKERLDKGDDLALLDIRQPHELQIARLDNSIHIPLGEIPERLAELNALKEKDLVVFCRTGRRSLDAREFLASNGFRKVFNLTGGLHAWSDDVDPSVMKY